MLFEDDLISIELHLICLKAVKLFQVFQFIVYIQLIVYNVTIKQKYFISTLANGFMNGITI